MARAPSPAGIKKPTVGTVGKDHFKSGEREREKLI
jgi:hypothetical protein